MSTNCTAPFGFSWKRFSMQPPMKMPMQAPGTAIDPVKTLAWLFPRLNCVSRYFGRNTTKPDTIISSMQAPRQVTMYTGFVTRRHMDWGISAGREKNSSDTYLQIQ
uniref:Uncharacterized protein n=1 Tax=Anopheles coluzzii TaxID=1518534 RepID=A0A8W7PB42_ANOCL